MSTKLSYKKAKKFLNILNEESAVYIDDKENDLFEGGSLISSQLGGEMHKLRYYVVISTKKYKNFTPYQKEVTETGFKMTCKFFDSKLEKIKFLKNYALIKILVPVNRAVGEVIDEALEPLSKRGGFLRFHYLVTNTYKPNLQEIRNYLKNF